MMELDYEKIGLKVGLEIHQQLDTSTKLFCNCKPELFKEEPEIVFLRRLRPTQSELGQVDPAALFEFQKGLKIRYQANTQTSCLVEMDEEPPHALNREAVEIALTAALMMKAKPVDEIHVMRKTVIDGSNTTGFQRTCLVALNGETQIGKKNVPIQQVSLEEDAARKMGEEEGNVICYRIDRLGIPLIEVTTAPVIKSPKETGEVALAIGSILRATGKVKRGLGTIRQDLNISIPNGALVEIKGVQELELVPLAVEYEVQRQLNLLKIKEELEKRKVREEEVTAQFHDVTHVFKQTESKIIRKALETGKSVFALVLPKFKGLLKWELLSNLRLGTEMADRAKFWGQVGGIFHTDEMPAYGISTEEVERMKSAIKVGESDAAVFVVDCEEKAKNALRAVAERAREALRGVPDETRAANVDGTSRYMRPRPGPARMYPETDIPLMQVTSERLESLASKLPEPPEQRLKHLMKEHRLNEKLARQIMESEYGELFETVTGKSHVPSTTVAAFLTETLKSLKRTGVRVESVSESQIEEIFQALDSGEIAKESLPEIAKWLSEHEKKSVMEAVTDTGLKMMSREELEKIIDEALRTDELLVEARGINALGPLMNTIMKKVRGKAIADVVNRLLRERLEAQGGRKREKK